MLRHNAIKVEDGGDRGQSGERAYRNEHGEYRGEHEFALDDQGAAGAVAEMIEQRAPVIDDMP